MKGIECNINSKYTHGDMLDGVGPLNKATNTWFDLSLLAFLRYCLLGNFEVNEHHVKVSLKISTRDHMYLHKKDVFGIKSSIGTNLMYFNAQSP